MQKTSQNTVVFDFFDGSDAAGTGSFVHNSAIKE
jgi:hypothetical protein